jgi:hypothetical protein
MNFNPQQEDAMQAKSKSGKAGGAARGPAAKPEARRGRGMIQRYDAWEQIAQIPDDRDDEIDYRRIVQGESGRTLPVDDGDCN